MDVSRYSRVQGENITETPTCEITREMEIYSQLVLTLFVPHRCVEDLKETRDGKTLFTVKLQQEYAADRRRRACGEPPLLFTDANENYLKNVQNAAHNSLHYKISEDELQATTVPLQTEDDIYDCATAGVEDESDGEEEEHNCRGIEFFLSYLEATDPLARVDTDPAFQVDSLAGLKFRKHRNKGLRFCGYIRDIEAPACEGAFVKGFRRFVKFIEDESPPHLDGETDSMESDNEENRKRETSKAGEAYSVKTIVKLL